MSTPFIAEIKIFPFNFPPKGWAFCNGQLLPINQNQALFSLLGTLYGGNGQTTFGLPNLQGRTPIHFGSGFTQGQVGGESNHTLTISEMPTHNHLVSVVSNDGGGLIPTSARIGTSATNSAYGPLSAPFGLDVSAMGAIGGSQPHSNEQPYLVLNFSIALSGIFPSQN